MKLACVVLAAAFLLGCGRNIENKEAVRRGVLAHLSGRPGLDVNAMEIDVTAVTFREREADATVSFRPRGMSDPGAGMQMNYTLERRGNQWVVKSKSEKGAVPHGLSGQANQPSPPKPEPPAKALPPGHPSVDTTNPAKNK